MVVTTRRATLARWYVAASRSGMTLAVLVAVFAAGFVLYGVSHVARYDVMSESFYLDAMEREGIYERIYEELLADPALSKIVDPLLGNMTAARPFAISITRLVLPPETIKRGTEIAAAEWVHYLRGPTDTWQPHINVAEAREHIGPVVSSYMAGRVALAPEQILATIEQFNTALQPRLEDLREGRIPVLVPAFEAQDAEEAEDIASLLLSRAPRPVPDELREQLVVMLLAGDTNGALALAAPLYLAPQLEQSVRDWQAQLAAGQSVDLIGAFSALTEERQADLTRNIQEARSTIRLLGLPLALTASAMMLGSLGGLLWLAPRQGASRRRWIGSALLACSAAGVVLALAATAALDAWMASWLSRLPYGFPPSLRSMLDDYLAALLTDIRWSIVPMVIGTALAGVVLVSGRWVLAHTRVQLRRVRQPGRAQWRGAVLAGSVAGLLLVLGGTELARALPEDEHLRCNGHHTLCDRPLNEVVFPGTHNSMAAANMGWIFPNHDQGIETQLNVGYRALLLDTHYWEASQAHISGFREQFPPARRAAFDEFIDRIEAPRPGPFLCHGFCGFGAIALEEGLASIARFLHAHPHEVLILSMEDYISPADTAEAFAASGLLPFVYTPTEESEGWPTLRELIESGQRVIVFSEHAGGDPEWYLPQWDYVQDNPFAASSPADLSCAPERGDPEAAIFLMNHWMATSPADRTHAVRINARSFLLARAEQCEAERGMRPTIIAVDFASIGDTVRVTDELNRRGPNGP